MLERPEVSNQVYTSVLLVLHDNLAGELRSSWGDQDFEHLADAVILAVLRELDVPAMVSEAYQDGMDFMRRLVETIAGQEIPDPQGRLL